MKREIYSVGDCPVCPGSSKAVIFLRTDGSPVFFCPLCEVAWRNLPIEMAGKDILSLSDVAPNGIRLPNGRELVELKIAFEVVTDAWCQEEVLKHVGA